MRTILTLVGKDFANFRRNRAALVLTFLVPISLIYIFGQVFGLNRKDSGPNGITLAVVNASDNPAAQKLVDALKAESAFRVVTNYVNADKSERPLTETDVRAMIHDREFRFAVVIPSDVIPESGFGLHLKILSDPRNEIESQTVNGLLQKTIFSSVPELLGQSLQARAKKFLGSANLDRFNTGLATAITGAFGGDPARVKQRIASGDLILADDPPAPAKPVDPSLRRLDATATPAPTGTTPPAAPVPAATSDQKSATADFFSRIVKIDSEQVVGKDVKSPEATRVIGGQAMMFLLFALSGGSAAFFDEKNTGIFQRLLSAPVSRAQLMWSRFIWGVLLGLFQLTALFVAGHFMFGVDVFNHVGGLLVICTAAAATCTAFGMFIAAFTPNAQAASGLATFLVLTMSATGGAWFPISFMPPFMQTIGHFTITYWAMEGFSQVLWAGDPLIKILPTIGLLFGIAGAVMALSIWRLNRRNIFG
jgi:ABC-2 type transport system permease protein